MLNHKRTFAEATCATAFGRQRPALSTPTGPSRLESRRHIVDVGSLRMLSKMRQRGATAIPPTSGYTRLDSRTWGGGILMKSSTCCCREGMGRRVYNRTSSSYIQ